MTTYHKFDRVKIEVQWHDYDGGEIKCEAIVQQPIGDRLYRVITDTQIQLVIPEDDIKGLA